MSSLKTNFVLKSVKAKEKPILLVLNFGYKEFNPLSQSTSYKPLKYYTGVSVDPKEWDKVNKLPLSKTKVKTLFEIEQIAKDVFNYLKLENETITPDLLKDEIDIKLDRVQRSNNTLSIVQYIREIIVAENSTKSERTIKQYQSLANKISAYESSTGKKMYAHTLSEEQFTDFLNYVRGTVNKINSVWSIYKSLRAVLKDIGRRYNIEVFRPSEQLAQGDKVQRVSEDKIYFTFEQIEQLLKYEPKNERLQNVQFILMVLLFTGCRYSDVFKIALQHEYKKNGTAFMYAHYLSEKTDTEIKVPILKPLQEFFDRNEGKPPYRISEQKFNKYVKELVQLCELSEEVTLSFTNAQGQKEFETRKFYEFVSSHIGRRSFITNLINFVPITILAKITGHTIKDRSIIFGYNKITLLENAALFVKELKRLQESNREDFPFDLV